MLKEIIRKIKFHYCDNYKRAQLHSKEGVKMGKNCQVYGVCNFSCDPYLVEFGDNVVVADKCSFITHDGGVGVLRVLNKLPKADKFGQIKVGNNVFFGMRCTVLAGVNIGNNVVIGVGSVVTRDIPDNSVAAGVPARVIKSIEEYYEGLKDKVDFTKGMSSIEKQTYLTKKYNLK